MCFLSFVWRQSELAFFGARLRSRTFLFLQIDGGSMGKEIPKKVIDITGVELMPGEPTVCLGNGEQGFECCCDECDYYLLCFPKFEPKKQIKNVDDSKT